MAWLFGPVIASIVASFVVVRIFDAIFGGIAGSIANTARASLFVSTWTAVTAKSGMDEFNSRVRKLRHGNAAASELLEEVLTKRERQ